MSDPNVPFAPAPETGSAGRGSGTMGTTRHAHAEHVHLHLIQHHAAGHGRVPFPLVFTGIIPASAPFVKAPGKKEAEGREPLRASYNQ